MFFKYLVKNYPDISPRLLFRFLSKHRFDMRNVLFLYVKNQCNDILNLIGREKSFNDNKPLTLYELKSSHIDLSRSHFRALNVNVKADFHSLFTIIREESENSFFISRLFFIY